MNPAANDRSRILDELYAECVSRRLPPAGSHPTGPTAAWAEHERERWLEPVPDVDEDDRSEVA